MGGRGTFASGNSVAYRYETVGTISGVKILEPIIKKGSWKLPEEAHSSSAYVLLDKTGKFKVYREYDSNHRLTLEIANHPEPNLDPSLKPVLHIHFYDVDFNRTKAQRLSTELYKKYKKFFKGVDDQ
jgi:hypothetical protein